MLFLQKLGKSFLYILGIFFILTFLVTLLNMINVIGPKGMIFFKIAIPILSLFMGGIIIGRKSVQKGWLEGLKLSIIVVVLLALLNFLGFDQNFQIKQLLFYVILIVSSMFGSMVGINIDKKEAK